MAPNNDDTWKLLISKHPSSACPAIALPSNTDFKSLPDVSLMDILRSFPKLTAVGPSGRASERGGGVKRGYLPRAPRYNRGARRANLNGTPPPPPPLLVFSVSMGPSNDMLPRASLRLSPALPSGLPIQHLIDVAEVPLQTPLLHTLHDVINLLISGSAPLDIAIFLAGGNLTALNMPIPGDILPIAVEGALHRLTLCVAI